MALSTIPPVRQRRPRNSRTKTGCLVCRLRRKKCDEATPTCKNCVRNNLICSWPRTLVHSSSQRRSDLGWRIRLQEGVLDATTRIKAERELRPTDEHLHVTQDILKDDVTSQRLGASKGRLPTPSCSKIWANPSVWEPAIIKTSESQTLLSHFMNETAVQLVAREPQHNPLLSFVLPWAHSETMIMDAMMALGGAHVSHKTGNPALRAATTKHYLSGIRGLKYALTHWNSGAPQATVRLLTVAMLLCQYEAVTCNRRIIAYYHLRASREFISTIFEAGVGNLLSQQREVFGFLLEYYTYMAIVRNITITSDRRMDVVASDWFVQSLQHLQGYQTFGSMLGSSWELYELIPTIPLLQDLDGEPWTMAYLDLEEKIINWSPVMTTRSETPAWVQSSTAVDRIYQIALLTFLYSARYMKNDDKDEFCQKLDPIIIEFRVLCGQLRGSPSRTRLLWPLLVIGSCLSSPEDRQKMCSGLSGSTYDMAITQRAVEILQMTWELDKEGMYGPVALETVVKSHDFCVS